jgi:glutaredoxin
VREFLSASGVEFEDRNIRASRAHREELLERTGALVVPRLVYGERVVVGFDPDALAEVVADYRAARQAAGGAGGAPA